MNDIIFPSDLPEVRVQLIAGPSYFGMLSIAREVAHATIGPLYQLEANIVIINDRDPDQEAGIRLEIPLAGNDERGRQIAAAIHQSMMLPDAVRIEVVFTDIDVMLPDLSELLAEQVVENQKALHRWTNYAASPWTGWYE